MQKERRADFSTYAIADVPAAVGHRRATVTPAPALSTVGPTVRSAAIGPRAGARSAIVPPWAAMRVRSTQRSNSNIHSGSVVLHIELLSSCSMRHMYVTKKVSPRFGPGTRSRFGRGVAGAFFWTGRWAGWGAACRLPRGPRTHAPGCGARLLNESHTHQHTSYQHQGEDTQRILP